MWNLNLPPGVGALPGEEPGAHCVVIDGINLAWTDDDNVYQYLGAAPVDDHDDGFRVIGRLDWPDDDDDVGALRGLLARIRAKPGSVWIVEPGAAPRHVPWPEFAADNNADVVADVLEQFRARGEAIIGGGAAPLVRIMPAAGA